MSFDPLYVLLQSENVFKLGDKTTKRIASEKNTMQEVLSTDLQFETLAQTLPLQNHTLDICFPTKQIRNIRLNYFSFHSYENKEK